MCNLKKPTGQAACRASSASRASDRCQCSRSSRTPAASSWKARREPARARPPKCWPTRWACVSDGPWDSVYPEPAAKFDTETVNYYFEPATSPFGSWCRGASSTSCSWRNWITWCHKSSGSARSTSRRPRNAGSSSSWPPATSTGKLPAAVRHRFANAHYHFGSGPGFADAINAWLPSVWAAEVGQDVDMPYGWQRFGWKGMSSGAARVGHAAKVCQSGAATTGGRSMNDFALCRRVADGWLILDKGVRGICSPTVTPPASDSIADPTPTTRYCGLGGRLVASSRRRKTDEPLPRHGRRPGPA